MSNMAYCRFHNTAQDLADCEEHLFDDDLSPQEQRARLRLIKQCMAIAMDGECFIEEEEQKQAKAEHEKEYSARVAGGDMVAQEADWEREQLRASQEEEINETAT